MPPLSEKIPTGAPKTNFSKICEIETAVRAFQEANDKFRQTPSFTEEEIRDARFMQTDLDQLSINTIRTLAMDAVQAANSGHPGTSMVLAPVAGFFVSRIDSLLSRRLPIIARCSARRIKFKKSGANLILDLEPTVDILLEVSRTRHARLIVVGFAAETINVIEHARAKLIKKIRSDRSE